MVLVMCTSWARMSLLPMLDDIFKSESRTGGLLVSWVSSVDFGLSCLIETLGLG